MGTFKTINPRSSSVIIHSSSTYGSQYNFLLLHPSLMPSTGKYTGPSARSTQCGSASGARRVPSTRPDQRRTVGARPPRDMVTCHAVGAVTTLGT